MTKLLGNPESKLANDEKTSNRDRESKPIFKSIPRTRRIEYFLPKLEIKDCNAMLDEQNFVISQRKLI